MMPKYILELANVSRKDLARVGGKAANLGELTAEGFPVPPGFVVVTGAYERVFASITASLDLGGFEHLAPLEQETLSQEIRRKFSSTPLPVELLGELERAHQTLEATREEPVVYAVRSSATAEDLVTASFAGQHDTYYYVTQDSLIPMIRKCWASLWNEAAISYRASNGIDHSAIHMAVVLQKMILSDVSGITFTANPLTGDSEEIISESSWGMGAAIVDGRVTPDHFRVARDDLTVLEQRIADKKFLVPAVLNNLRQSRLREVPLKKRQKASLQPREIRTVTEWGIKAEQYFGSPQDIEWCLYRGQYFMLQSRPITRSGAHDQGQIPDGQYVLFKAVAENFTGPLYPLTSDLIVRPLSFMETIYGRVYVNMAYLKRLVPLKLSDKHMASLVYLRNNHSDEIKIDWKKIPAFLLILLFNYLISEVFYLRMSNMPDDFMETFRHRMNNMVNDASVSTDVLMSRVLAGTRFFDPVGNKALLINIVAASRYPVFLGFLTNILRRWLPETRLDAESILCAGTDGILSTDMGRQIWQMAKTIRLSNRVSDIIKNQSPDKVLSDLENIPDASLFLEQLLRFNKTHGHRTLREFEIQSPRWEEDPSPIIGMIRNYLLADSDPDQLELIVQQHREELEAEISESLQTLKFEKLLRWRWRIINYLRNKTRYLAKQRENSRFYHIMAFYALRKKVLELEDQLIKGGQLKCQDDIFFLVWSELESLLSGHTDWLDVEDIIRTRRLKQIQLSKMSPPKTVGFSALQEDTHLDLDSNRSLHGQGASPGVCVGIARVILDPAVDATLEPGEILIAPYTDPAWTPLFLIAHAAVVEVGSYLSHAGTIAREYGMPCVVDVHGCTSRIKTGDHIRVNGTLGRVEFAEAPI